MDLAAPADPEEALTPLDWYLAEQADLSAVERFAQRHDDVALPAQARYYRDLIPLNAPGDGQQYGFEVDLDACTGCKACVTACHALNGLDEGESWRSVGTVETGADRPFTQTVTSTCHHCVDPACLNGCPVNAYEKDPITGIVAHLDDQCIGCRYCVLTCPYEVPRYSAERGIVRKCDMCADRLGAGEAPACVQSCPNAAIRVAVVDTEAARASATGSLVPGAPDSSLTVPTTVYTTSRDDEPAVAPAREPEPRRGQAHVPLTVMLVLTQVAVGTSLAGMLARLVAGEELPDALRQALALTALGVGVLALGASVLHLGRPAYAFRAILGVRRSWLSREIVAFAFFAALAAGHGVATLAGAGRLEAGLGALAATAGVVGVACSVQVYAVTRRRWWRVTTTSAKFALTTAATGIASVLVIVSAVALGAPTGTEGATWGRPLGVAVATLVAAKVIHELSFLRHLRAGAPPELARSARLLVGDLGAATRWRLALAGVGALAALGTAMTTAPTPSSTPVALATVALVAVVAGELVERWQFFVAGAAPRMPSSPR